VNKRRRYEELKKSPKNVLCALRSYAGLQRHLVLLEERKMYKYAIEIFYRDEDEGFIAVVSELPGCSAFGETENLAYLNCPVGQFRRSCGCPRTHINCMTPKEWLKSQLGVWKFYYEAIDIRDKSVHPATFPISLAQKVIELFTHKGELVLDPFVGSGTTLVAARDLKRNAVGFDLQQKYIDLCEKRLAQASLFDTEKQIAIHDDARNIFHYFEHGTKFRLRQDRLPDLYEDVQIIN